MKPKSSNYTAPLSLSKYKDGTVASVFRGIFSTASESSLAAALSGNYIELEKWLDRGEEKMNEFLEMFLSNLVDPVKSYNMSLLVARDTPPS